MEVVSANISFSKNVFLHSPLLQILSFDFWCRIIWMRTHRSIEMWKMNLSGMNWLYFCYTFCSCKGLFKLSKMSAFVRALSRISAFKICMAFISISALSFDIIQAKIILVSSLLHNFLSFLWFDFSGSICYLNSSMQQLFHIPLLRQRFLQGDV